MTALVWDQVGERLFETGVDRAVLFLNDGTAVAWNGITSVEEQPARETQAYYIDGVKYLERQIMGDFAGTLRAYTYPIEFEELMGVKSVKPGLSYHDQKTQSFSLVYRTRIGNDIEGADHGYRLHILYNVTAVPNTYSHESMGESPVLTQFTWGLRSIPSLIAGYKPTVHVSINSLETDPTRLAAMEDMLYGSAINDPLLLPIDQFTEMFEMYNSLVITDHGDGTWTATDLTNTYISMTTPTEFAITDADTTIIDANTYTIATTTPV